MMDANGQRFWLYADPAHFGALDDCVWQPQARVLTLARERAAPPEADRAPRSDDRLRRLPAVRDSFGQLARWDAAERMLRSEHGGLVPETASPVPPLDLALDDQQVLLMALDRQVRLVDLRGRFEPIRLDGFALPGGDTFSPTKLACDAEGGRWALDSRNRSLGRITGTPWRRRALVGFDPDTFRPHPENPHAPALQPGPALPAGIDPVLLACSPQGQLAVASWGVRGRCSLHRLTPTGWAAPRELLGAAHAHGLRWLDERHVALWAGALDEALVYDLDEPGTAPSALPLELLGRRYPLRQAVPDAPPVQSQDWPPHYLLAAGGSRPLVPLSWRAQATQGRAQLQRREAAGFDACWHRLNIEAELPEGCAVLIELAARDDEQTPDEADYHPHWLGDAALRPAHLPPDTPRAAPLRAASELPLHPGLAPTPGGARGGCYTVLIQRAGHSQRALRGRWLHGRVTLLGNGQRAPCVAALRVWGERYSYLSHYLPALYSDGAADDEAADRSQRGAATPADFTERFTQLFESELTRWEDLAANAHVLTGPHSAPPAALPWLASLLGQRLPAAFSPPQARAWLATAPQRVRQRGTLAGLSQALDVALDGAVGRGAVIVLEDFHLRRTLATLLGVDLGADDSDPLLPGLRPSANSRVGDGLILGEGADPRDFLTAFLPEALDDLVGTGEAEALTQDFYARTAHRATVLLHEALSPAQMRLAQGIVVQETPAHVAVRLLPARAPFLVGIAALVGVDSFLRDAPKPAWARVDRSRIGRGDVIAGGSLFDAVGAAPSVRSPVAVLDAPAAVSSGASFELRADRSSAADGRSLIRFRWTRLAPAG